jgi:hypothetical protein
VACHFENRSVDNVVADAIDCRVDLTEEMAVLVRFFHLAILCTVVRLLLMLFVVAPRLPSGNIIGADRSYDVGELGVAGATFVVVAVVAGFGADD